MTTELRTGHEAGDDGFHEIQLNGKQLVFLGMATTLVSVVIFLCGVLVGRGVRPIEPVAEAAAMGAPVAGSTPESTVVDATAPAGTPTPAAVDEPTPVSEDAAALPDGTAEAARAETAPARSTAAAPTAADAPKPVEAPKPAASAAKPEAARPETRTAGARTTEARTETTSPATEPAEMKPAETQPAEASLAEAEPAEPAAGPVRAPAAAPAPGGKVAVQVAALGSRADAEAVARRLSGKGYAAYIVSPEPGGKAVFRVRVGNYASLDEAQRISSRLAQEEKLKPWIIR